jgi:radical SAM protein with 4Fe4S-binding SPASM domain
MEKTHLDEKVNLNKFKNLNEIVVEITNRCNLDCKFCMIKQSTTKLLDMNIKTCKDIIDQAKKENSHGIRFTGGEPLLHKDLTHLIKYAKEIGLFTIMNTNATLINEKTEAIKYLDMILVSFHDESETEQLKKDIKTILTINSNIKINIATILSKQNIKNLDNLYKLINEINNYIYEWILLKPIKNEQNNNPINNDDLENASQKIRTLNTKYNLNIKISNSIPYCSTKDNINDISRDNLADNGISRLYIKSNGDIVTDSYSTEILGNIESDTINEIWYSEKLIARRNLKDIEKFCKDCYYLDRCMGSIDDKNLMKFDNIKPIVSLIIPTYNNSKMLEILLKSLSLQTVKKSFYEVIVVDDGSSDNTKEIYKKHEKDFIFSNYFYQEDLGFRAGQARNLGAKNAKGKILIFLDDDSIPSPNFIKNHVESQKSYDIILGYNASYGNDRDYEINIINKAIKLNKLNKLPIIPEYRDTLFKSNSLNNSKTNKKLWWNFAAGNFSIKKKIFDKYKFDNDFVGWAEEDVELGYRLQKENFLIKLDKTCLAYNVREKSNNQISMLTREKFISTTKNQMLFLKKHNNDEVKEYILNRFNNTPKEIKLNSKIDLEKIEFKY